MPAIPRDEESIEKKPRSFTMSASDRGDKGVSRTSVVSWTMATREEHLETSKDEIRSSLLVESGKLFRGWPFLEEN